VAAVRFQKSEDTSEDTMEEIYAGRNYEGQGRRTRTKDKDKDKDKDNTKDMDSKGKKR